MAPDLMSLKTNPSFANRRALSRYLSVALLLAALASAITLRAEVCQTGEDLDATTKAALETTARHYFDLAAKSDIEGLRAASIPSIAADFSGIAAAIKDNQSVLTGATATPKSSFLLSAEGTAPIERAEFLCGVFGKNGQTPTSAVFVLNGLPPGKYAVVILDVTATDGLYKLSLVLQQIGADWKLGGFYLKAAQSAGHDSAWFAEQARAFKAKSQLRNSWLYFAEARNLASPIPFMSTMETDRLYDETQLVLPTDFPGDKPLDLAAEGKTYRVKTMFAFGIAGEVNLVVKYDAADVSNVAAAYADNQAVAKALLARFPEFKDGFGALIPRATEPSGRDYGTLVPTK